VHSGVNGDGLMAVGIAPIHSVALEVLSGQGPDGGVGASGTRSRHGGPQANIEAFTETQWVTVRGDLPGYPF
jgi:hypothetical protein